MAAQGADMAIRQTGNGIKRRGLLAGAAALVAGIAAQRTSAPVAAATGGTQGTAMILGANSGTGTNNTATELTVLVNNHGTNSAASTGASYGTGLLAIGSDDAQGLRGVCFGTGGWGVFGWTNVGIGVVGATTGGIINAPQKTGVYGTSFQSGGTGVLGESTSGVGVHGKTFSGLYGIVGESGTVSGSAGLLGVANGPNAVGFGTIAQGGATFAGYFNGTTVVNGTFAVTGGKSAAVKDANGDYRLMYCVEAPEAWFEDAGKAKLSAGKADVRLDPQFAQHIRADDYQVFLTPYDPACKGLAVASLRTDGFAVQELHGGTSSGEFAWRVMAKRNDIKAERLAKFAMPPGLTLPETPAASAAPAPQPQPAPPSRPASSPAAASPDPAQSPTVQPAPPSRP